MRVDANSTQLYARDAQTPVENRRVGPYPLIRLVQQHTQRVNIRGGRYGISPHLMTPEYASPEQLEPWHGRGKLPAELRVEELGNAEIQQLGRVIRGDEYVAWLDVAVDHQVLMRVLHGRTHFHEQLQTGCRVERVALAVLDNRQAFDVLHREVRQTVGRGASVEQAGDIRMIQAGENLTFVAEPLDDRVGVGSPLEDLMATRF